MLHLAVNVSQRLTNLDKMLNKDEIKILTDVTRNLRGFKVWYILSYHLHRTLSLFQICVRKILDRDVNAILNDVLYNLRGFTVVCV